MISLTLLLIIVGVYLLIIALIDIKFHSVPAIFTTGAIFAVAFLLSSNLLFGILAFILSWLLIEAEFFSGLADLKIAVLLGFLISNSSAFVLFTFLILFYGVAYKIILIKYLKKNNNDEIAFIPVFLFVFVTLVIVHVFKWLSIFSLQ